MYVAQSYQMNVTLLITIHGLLIVHRLKREEGEEQQQQL